MEDIRTIKQRFEIIGNDIKLNRAIEKSCTSGTHGFYRAYHRGEWRGERDFSRIIHSFSARKHAQYIAVNCGGIPEGTIDSNYSATRKAHSRERYPTGKVTSRSVTGNNFPR